MKKLSLFCGVIFIFILFYPEENLYSQQRVVSANKLDSVVVEASRAGANTPVTHSSINNEELKKSSSSFSVPMILSSIPSVVATTEGGNGLGYSSLRIRGSDASRINVTLNGIAINDGESQQVFWVNIPALQSVLEDIQVMRGVGTSVNGSGAFGASINMRTLFTSPEPYAMAEFGAGSFNTYTKTVGVGTGRTANGFSFDLRFSQNSGDGYIRNAKTDLKSLYAAAGWHKGSNAFKLNYIMGDQVSGITWEGISRSQMEVDRRYNPAGAWHDEAGNERYYDNETDNYVQHHVQLHHSLSFSPKVSLNTTLHLTKGDGYYENYKENKNFSSYGIENQIIEGEEYSKSDFIIRQALDNYYYALNTNLIVAGENVRSTSGFSFSYFSGDHFGDLLWSKFNSNIEDNHQWYFNQGYKTDYSVFTKIEKELGRWLVLFADLQYRGIVYELDGDDKDFVSLNWKDNYGFFNPKAGLTLNFEKSRIYASIAVAHKEPGRSDIKESVKAGRADEILPERMTDIEAGYSYITNNFCVEGNLYFMEYDNQLVPTGKLSETGYVVKENVKNSYRRGIEIGVAWQFLPYARFEGNMTASVNKIKEYSQYVDIFDDNWSITDQERIYFNESDIAFSPSLTGMGVVSFTPVDAAVISFSGKYVGGQYMDNTSNDGFRIPAYSFFSLNLSYDFEIRNRKASFGCFIDNIFDNMYYSNAWVYRAKFTDGTLYSEEGVYPQAGRNFMLKFSVRL